MSADLIGRDGELSAIEGMLRDTGGRGLLLVGEPGIGKSALLRAAADMAGRDGRTVLRAAGVQAETRVPYAGLHQLLYPLAAALESLAPRPRQVLRAAFGHAEGPAPDMFPAAVATLELLAGAAAGAGLLVAADDLHWMDDATLGVLRFVARRIASVPIALLATIRYGFEDVLVEADMPVLMLRPLGRDEAERLVRARHPDLDARGRERVLEHAAGNPLALTRPATRPPADLDLRLRVRDLADLAAETIEAGDLPLALRLLTGAVRAWSDDRGPETGYAPAEVSGVPGGKGGLTALPRLLAQQAQEAIEAEAVRLGGPPRQPWHQAAALIGQAMSAGMRGDRALAGQLARNAEAVVLPARIGAALCGIQFVRGVTAIGARRYEEAFDQLARMFDRADPSYQVVQSTWALGDLAESAARTGRAGQAREIVAAFGPAQGGGVTPWTRVALLYAAPLLADEEAAEREFRRALEANLARWPFYRARLLLEYGSWLRRRRRIVEARAPLRHAHQVCEAHGLLPWAERARQELRATGEGREAPRAAERTPLSPQELQIARLAAEGLSNREIGQRLYLSHRTIGSHLYRIFPKLGIGSRAQLGAALAAADAGYRPGAPGAALPPSPR